MKILYISPINTVGTLDLWKKFHESQGNECKYITLFKSPLDVNNGICLNLPFVAHSKSLVGARRTYYKMTRGDLGEYEPKEGCPPVWAPSSILESGYFKFRDWWWSFKIESIIKQLDLESYDIYHLEWGLDFYRSAKFIKRLNNKKIICTYHGQDLRTRGVIPDVDKISNLNLTSELDLLEKQYISSLNRYSESVDFSFIDDLPSAKIKNIFTPILFSEDSSINVKLFK